jgi:hypothetical protein
MSDKNILTAAIITVGSTTAASILPENLGGQGKLPSPQLYIGAGLTFFGLSALSGPAPKIAGYLSVGIATTAFIVYGSPLLANWFAGKLVQPIQPLER